MIGLHFLIEVNITLLFHQATQTSNQTSLK